MAANVLSGILGFLGFWRFVGVLKYAELEVEIQVVAGVCVGSHCLFPSVFWESCREGQALSL